MSPLILPGGHGRSLFSPSCPFGPIAATHVNPIINTEKVTPGEANLAELKMSSPRRRIETDVMKMLMSNYEVNLINDNMQDFHVIFHGPSDTPFQGGAWKIHVEIPDHYPFKSPSIGFINRIFHPNIDEMSGSVCLDVINQTWSPMFDLVNIFEVFLPQLLRYPNPADPLNGEAAALLIREPKMYDQKVKEYVQKYAIGNDNELDAKDESDVSSIMEYSDNDIDDLDL